MAGKPQTSKETGKSREAGKQKSNIYGKNRNGNPILMAALVCYGFRKGVGAGRVEGPYPWSGPVSGDDSKPIPLKRNRNLHVILEFQILFWSTFFSCALGLSPAQI